MSALWLWMLSFSYADMLQTTPLEKKEADKLLSLSKRMLRKERGLSIRTGRFLVPQKGYKYRVVVDGIRDEERAGKIASRLISVWSGIELITSSGQNKVYHEEEKTFIITLPVENVEVSNEKTQPKKSETERVEPEKATQLDTKAEKKEVIAPTVEDILSYATEAMEKMSKKWVDVKSEQFVFVRELTHNGQKIKTKHTFLQKGDAMRLEIHIEEGVGEDSTTILTPKGKGFLSVKDKKTERSALRTQEILKTFSSKEQLSILLNFPKDVRSNGPWRSLDAFEKIKDAWRVFVKEDENRGVIKQAIFSEKEGWLIQLIVRDEKGDLEYRWTDYTDLGDGTFIPFTFTRIRNGYVQETILIQNLYFNISLNDRLFSEKR